MLRSVCPEILDTLPASNPDAQASRRDLRRINQLMGNNRWLARRLSSKQTHGEMHLVEIGAGDGTLAKRLHDSIAPSTYTAVDLAPQPESWLKNGIWLQTDLLSIDYAPDATHLIANLILHHFEAPALKAIGERIQNSHIHTILACEPCRRSIHQAQLKAGKLIGFNHVTLHDGVVSVRAGFRANELPLALNLDSDKWNCTIKESFMGAYRMIAKRK